MAETLVAIIGEVVRALGAALKADLEKLELRPAEPGKINHVLAQIVASLNVAAAVVLPPAVRFW